MIIGHMLRRETRIAVLHQRDLKTQSILFRLWRLGNHRAWRTMWSVQRLTVGALGIHYWELLNQADARFVDTRRRTVSLRAHMTIGYIQLITTLIVTLAM